jgi:hypothetical protein
MSEENEQTAGFDPWGLLRVETIEDIRALPANSEGVFVRRHDDAKLAVIASHLPGLRHLVQDGSPRISDDGLEVLRHLKRLEHLDLEWSNVTDRGLLMIASVPCLRWVDVGFCEGVSSQGVADLRSLRPDLGIVDTTGQQAAATDGTGPRWRAPLARDAIVDARVPQVSGRR